MAMWNEENVCGEQEGCENDKQILLCLQFESTVEVVVNKDF